MRDPIVPRCVRGNHYCTELCEVAHGLPCQPPAGDPWRPRGALRGFARGSAVANYCVLREALPEVELNEEQQRCLRWLAGWDDDTAQAVAGLFRLARAAP